MSVRSKAGPKARHWFAAGGVNITVQQVPKVTCPPRNVKKDRVSYDSINSLVIATISAQNQNTLQELPIQKDDQVASKEVMM